MLTFWGQRDGSYLWCVDLVEWIKREGRLRCQIFHPDGANELLRFIRAIVSTRQREGATIDVVRQMISLVAPIGNMHVSRVRVTNGEPEPRSAAFEIPQCITTPVKIRIRIAASLVILVESRHRVLDVEIERGTLYGSEAVHGHAEATLLLRPALDLAYFIRARADPHLALEVGFGGLWGMAISRVTMFFSCSSTKFPVVEAVAKELGLGVGVAFHEALCGAVGSGH